jgi:hypothetical protein
MSDPETGSGRPATERGRKITNSPYRDEAAIMLLTDKGVEATKRFLSSKGMNVSNRTVKAFRESYVATLDQQVKDKLLESCKVQQQKEQQAIVDIVAHHKLTSIESTVELLKVCEKLLAQLNDKSHLNTWELQSCCNLVDRVKLLREHLSRLQQDSEVEQARTRAIEDVSEIALAYFLGNPVLAEEFIKKVAAYKSRIGLQVTPQG